jgi:8-oxo-dGTP diphosphatase
MSTQHATAHICADIVALGIWKHTQSVLLIERKWSPYQGQWAFPGGHVDDGETFIQAAQHELQEETGLTVNAAMLHQVNIYDAPNRDPRGRYISVAYAALLWNAPTPVAGDDARTAQWVPLVDVIAHPERLAFDHAHILNDALRI